LSLAAPFRPGACRERPVASDQWLVGSLAPRPARLYLSGRMAPFAWGLLVGCLSSLVLATAAALAAYRRYERLQRRARQAERLAELGTLTGGLAHEIKNPLSTIQLNLQLLREDLPDDEPFVGRIVNRLTTVQKEAQRLRDILDDFLRYAGRMELVRKPVDVAGLLEEMVDFFHPQAQLQRVQLRLRRPDEPLIVPLDERMMKQAMLNLMINAVHAMPAGGEIILSARREDGRAVIEVADTGRGMEPDVLERIFQAYYSTKKGGHGLGLAISKRIVEEHGGSISAVSELGKGTLFRIELPA
jgi:two-component system sensor histidine kinase HydH